MRRRGISLVELLVVIAIIGTAILLFLPAIAGGQQAARRIACMNNFRQITLASLNYHQEFETFPPGYTVRPSPGGGSSGSVWGWAVPLLPYMEQSTLSMTVHRFKPVDAPENMTTRTVRISSMLCGGRYRSAPDAHLSFPASQKGQPPVEIAPASYVGSFGTRDPLDPRWNGQGDGVFFKDSSVALHQIPDGISTTFMVGERDRRTGRTAWAGGIGPDGVTMVVGSTGDDDGPNGKPVEPWQFSSSHDGGAHFGYPDGSVRFLSSTVSKAIYQALATRNGGEVVDELVE